MTGSSQDVADNFGVNLMDRKSRYENHYEFVEAVQQFWGTWGEDALKADKASGVFADYRKVNPAYISGKHVQANGALAIPLLHKDNR